MAARKGKLFVITAPSGAGKTTLVRRLIENHPNLKFSVSHTTRAARPKEKDGVDYYFLGKDRFEAMIGQGAFLEHAEVFGNFYGTSRTQVEKLRLAGNDVLLEIDWQGARQVRSNQPDCCSVFVMPPSLTELERRLHGRGTDAEDVIARRLGEAREDMSHWPEFNHVVINDDLETAAGQLEAIVAGVGQDSKTTNPRLRKRIEALLEKAARRDG